MKKSLIALAVVSTFAAQAAMADNTTIYGAANVSLDAVNNGSTTNGQSTNHVSSNVSKLGFKGSEDLGDGLSAIWQIEEQVNFVSSGANSSGSTNSSTNFSNSNNVMTARDTFVGLSSGSLGTVIAGIHDTPYKMATRGYDLFADTIADNRSIMGTSGVSGFAFGDLRLNNVLAYISPSFSGFTIAAATISGAEIASVAGATKGSAESLALLYGAGPISASFAWQKVTVGSIGTGTLGANVINGLNAGLANVTAANDSVSAWKIGGGYDFGQGVVNAVYEKNSSSIVAGAGVDLLARTAYYLSGKYNVNSNDAVKVAYTHANSITAINANSSGAKQFSLGYDHNLSKHTTVYALYSKLTNDTNTSQYTFSQATSINGAVAGTAGTSIGNNGAPSVFSLGMKHAF